MRMKKALLFVMSVLLLGSAAFAQDSKRSPYMPWEVGADLGISLFGNEFNMNKEARWNIIDHWSSDVGFGGELYVRKYFGYVLGAELNYSYNTLKGDWDESFGSFTPMNFETKVNDITLQAVVNFNNLFSKERWDRDWYIYGKAGFGIGWVNNEVASNVADLDDTKILIPLGLGAAYKLSDDIKVHIGADWKFMDTDRLDGRYETGVAGSIGEPTTGVWGSYAMFTVGASYTFGKYRGQEKSMTSMVIPESKPAPKPAPKPTTVAPVVPQRPAPKPTPPPTQYKPTPKPAVKPAPTPTMSYDVIDGTMMAQAGWPVNKGYVYGEIPTSGVKYRVQVFATYHQAKTLEHLGNMIRVSDEMIEYRGKKLYKYAVKKTYDSYKSALAAARQINRTAKIKDAFVVAFKGTKQIY